MEFFKVTIFTILLHLSGATSNELQEQPNIIIITADDMGWNDVSFHGSSLFLTPNIDALAYHGVILNDFHVAALCTPSRAALMTGKFPSSIGMQRSVILEAEPRGLPLNRRLLPQYLKASGYRTHLVGKWHLGFYKEEYTPTKRGFDSFYGYWQGHRDYFDFSSAQTFGQMNGYDNRNNLKVDWTTQGEYSTDLFTRKAVELIHSHDKANPLFLYLSQIAPHAGTKTEPLQVPKEEESKFSYIPDTNKRKYAAIMSKLDQSVGRVLEALNVNKMLDNSIILFMSDNGAPTVGLYSTTGSNYPFRGIKQTEWEGGTRVPAFIWSPLLAAKQRVSKMMMHIVDVLPTLLSAAGISTDQLYDIDGINMWEPLLKGIDNSPRSQYPYNIDPAGETNAVGAVRFRNWKYFKGNENTTGEANTWYSDLALDPFTATYDTDLILKSLANEAITSVYKRLLKLKKVTKQDENEIDEDEQKPQHLTAQKIQHIRNEAIITCHVNRSAQLCQPEIAPCLIDLQSDACERYNLAKDYPHAYKNMEYLFESYRETVVPPSNVPDDPKANPDCWGGVWVPWSGKTSSACRKPLLKRILVKITDGLQSGLHKLWYHFDL